MCAALHSPQDNQMDAGHEARSFGDLLRGYRAARGLSQDELAERAGLSLAAISALERGLTRWPYRDTVERLAGAMQLAPAERSALADAGRRPVRIRAGSSAAIGAALSETAAAPIAVRTIPRSTVPVPLTGLIGRSTELEGLEQLFSGSQARLLTVIDRVGLARPASQSPRPTGSCVSIPTAWFSLAFHLFRTFRCCRPLSRERWA